MMCDQFGLVARALPLIWVNLTPWPEIYQFRAETERLEGIGGRTMLHLIMFGCLFAILFSLLDASGMSAGFNAIVMGGAFIGAIIYGILTEA
ncbi:MAG TPA: hypothetical protein VLQ65_07790 [Saliniramus sp.]|nr:hypothetical protein [Saliniramus sp.]